MNGTYADGDFFFNQALVGSTRADHFASDWFVGRAIYPTDFTDMAFSMTFVAAVPAPPSLVLLSISVVFLSGRALWRRGIGNLRVKGDSTMA
jgi:hypothetical protein